MTYSKKLIVIRLLIQTSSSSLHQQIRTKFLQFTPMIFKI